VEKIEAKIEFFKTLFVVFITALFSMIAYSFVYFPSLSNIKKIILLYAIIVFIIIVLLLIFNWIKCIKKLKD
jgi:membrane protein YdbS with pleckstrin-like domain